MRVGVVLWCVHKKVEQVLQMKIMATGASFINTPFERRDAKQHVDILRGHPAVQCFVSEVSFLIFSCNLFTCPRDVTVSLHYITESQILLTAY